MKVTKYEHACFTVEKSNQILVVDPGNFTTDFIASENIVAVVITHQHADHFDNEQLAAIFAKNDDVLVLGPSDVVDKVEIENKRSVSPGEIVTVGKFQLEFFGGVHALIHETIPRPQNLGVLINDELYYPGDNLTLPGRAVDVLAIPAAAPWLKIGEVIDFLLAVNPRLAFPTHDAVASTAGKQLADRMLHEIGAEHEIDYRRLEAPLEM